MGLPVIQGFTRRNWERKLFGIGWPLKNRRGSVCKVQPIPWPVLFASRSGYF